MNDLPVLLLVAVLGIGIGFALGGMVNGLRGASSQVPSADAFEVATLWRDRQTRKLVLTQAGKPLPASARLTLSQRTHLLQAWEDLRLWLGAAIPAPAGPGAQPQMLPAPDGSPAQESLPAASQPAISPATAPAQAQVKAPSLNPVEVLFRAVSAEVGAPPKNRSIAAQVDEILQEKLEQSPLKAKGVRLLELPGRGLVVMVGLERYEGVDAVPDPEVRSLIRAAVIEWEARQHHKGQP